jgi:hypothetical protein
MIFLDRPRSKDGRFDMKSFLLIALVIGATGPAFAQTPSAAKAECKLTLAQAPVIRGIRLGMSVDQALEAIPGAEADSNLRANLSRGYYGFQSATVIPGSYDKAKERFEGINHIGLGFLDGRLVNFSVQYNGPEWRSKEQFAARVAAALNLPGVESWSPLQDSLGLECAGFAISVASYGPTRSTILLKDRSVDTSKLIHEREEVPKEKARRAFRP